MLWIVQNSRRFKFSRTFIAMLADPNIQKQIEERLNRTCMKGNNMKNICFRYGPQDLSKASLAHESHRQELSGANNSEILVFCCFWKIESGQVDSKECWGAALPTVFHGVWEDSAPQVVFTLALTLNTRGLHCINIQWSGVAPLVGSLWSGAGRNHNLHFRIGCWKCWPSNRSGLRAHRLYAKGSVLEALGSQCFWICLLPPLLVASSGAVWQLTVAEGGEKIMCQSF